MGSDITPRPAATVMLLREGRRDGEATGLEVFVLHRVAGMAFAPSVTVFPGGGVDPSDSGPVPWTGPDRQWWSAALGTDVDKASSLVVAAVRELFEETGVLLADGPASETQRQAVAEHRSSLADVLETQELELRSGLLRPWANWITPEGNPRRYDTFFFLAALPDGQDAQMLTTEAESGRWARPADLLAEHAAGTLAMMPPTLAMLIDLQQAGSVQWAMSQTRTVVPLMPTVKSLPGEPLQVEVDGRVFSLRRQGS
ncbi:8-oxo-dGTP pyrophosphatase MutT (NUDIX family) [Nakamurella sp. UYEF19]|uniref:NUDIX hydrolase n=1 Tax=Nakamurella sp. UYEF19 TaxID=1756392 RepID=UPI0033910C8E